MCHLALEWGQPLDVIRGLTVIEWDTLVEAVNERHQVS